MLLRSIPHASELASVGREAFANLGQYSAESAGTVVIHAIGDELASFGYPKSIRADDVALAVLRPSDVDTINGSDRERELAWDRTLIQLVHNQIIDQIRTGTARTLPDQAQPVIIKSPGTLRAAQERIIGHRLRKIGVVSALDALTTGTLFFLV